MTSTAPFTRLSSSLMPNETAICWPTIKLLLRRAVVTTAGSMAGPVMSGASARWEPAQRRPDPAVEIIDPSFGKYRLALTAVERLATGFHWAEGPVWFGDMRMLLLSNISNDRIMSWNEQT